jgi:hypothetical protein
MNVTLGVPRIKEIIDAVSSIKSPIITAALNVNDNERVAHVVKARIQRVFIKDVMLSIEEVYGSRQCYIVLKLDMDAISRHHVWSFFIFLTFPSLKSIRVLSWKAFCPTSLLVSTPNSSMLQNLESY